MRSQFKPREILNSLYIKPELYSLGMISKKTSFGNKVRCYNAERTICGILRSRNSLAEETVISAIKNYALWKGKDLNRLGRGECQEI